MDAGIRRVGPNPASAARPVQPAGARRERRGGRDFGAELEQQEDEEARPEPESAPTQDSADPAGDGAPAPPRVTPPDGTGSGLDVVA